jgi:hypothetical protein
MLPDLLRAMMATDSLLHAFITYSSTGRVSRGTKYLQEAANQEDQVQVFQPRIMQWC